MPLLEQREQEGRNRLDTLKALLVQIDAKKVALMAVQEAVSAVEDAGALDFEAIERQIREIESQIDGELVYNEETLKQTGSLGLDLEGHRHHRRDDCPDR